MAAFGSSTRPSRSNGCRAVDAGNQRELIQEIRLGSDQVVVDSLEMKPADIVASDMFCTVSRTFGRHRDRLCSGSIDHQLNLTGPLQRNEPIAGIVDTVAASSQQTVVLMDDRAVVPKGFYHPAALACRNGDRTALVIDDGVVLKETRGILGDRIQLPAKGTKRRAIDGVSMAHGNNVRVCLMNRGMENKAGLIDCVATFDDLAFVIRKN